MRSTRSRRSNRLNVPSALVCLSSQPENMRTTAGMAALACSNDMIRSSLFGLVIRRRCLFAKISTMRKGGAGARRRNEVLRRGVPRISAASRLHAMQPSIRVERYGFGFARNARKIQDWCGPLNDCAQWLTKLTQTRKEARNHKASKRCGEVLPSFVVVG
jgi:hypothetical protein